MNITDLCPDILRMVKKNILYIQYKKRLNLHLKVACEELLHDTDWDNYIPRSVGRGGYQTTIHECLWDFIAHRYPFLRLSTPLLCQRVPYIVDEIEAELDNAEMVR